MATFSRYFKLTLLHPKTAFETLVRDKHMMRQSAKAVLIMAVVYTFVYIFLIMGGGRPFMPWLAIPPDEYYSYNVWFCLPSMFLAWIFAAGVVQLIGHIFNSTGTYEQTFSVMGFGIGLASWATALHDIVTSFLGAVHIINQNEYEVMLNTPTIWRTLLWVQMAAYLLGFVVLFTEGVKVVHGMRGWQAIVCGIAGFVAYQFFFFIFNR